LDVAQISPSRLSDLIGAIYDCVVDPDRWPDTIGEICRDLDCMLGTIALLDLVQSQCRLVKGWSRDPAVFESVLAGYQQHQQDIVFLMRQVPLLSQPIDEPMAAARLASATAARATRYLQEVADAQGQCDSLQTIVLREPGRVGLFAAMRHDSVGPATDEDLDILRLLAPHIRRAVTIGDLLDEKKIEVSVLAATLDRLAMGIVVVADEGRILQANEVARGMFSTGRPVQSVNGRLTSRNSTANGELANAIKMARSNEARIGATGIGVALAGPAEPAAVAHVLPLARGDLRTRLVPQATAAVFVTQARMSAPSDIAAIAASFGLTRAETHMLRHLVDGAPLAEAAKALGIVEATARTHLQHIFAKTCTSRQSDLITLVARLLPQVRRTEGGD
jgi:DNA-binding CsgD family transcriptional regulator/PAS domain-containing protein